MSKADEKPVLLSKRKNIQLLIDYCLDQRVGFNVIPRAISNDEFEVEIDITNIKQAIALGMFAKENKFEVTGMGELLKPKSQTVKKADVKEAPPAALLKDLAPKTEKPDTEKKEETTLNFGLGVNNN
jgi:hypothetical protein